jgi:hypothetical protein
MVFARARFGGFEVAEKASEGGFESVVGFPVAEIGDEVFAEFDGEICGLLF